ncbi:DNA-binding anti-repressor SinI [Bacillus aerolatus]|uniref:DNA-binding anti-repressor SinI n=1 Tax=Bacillus aerolatus TaxID=2653354 RepID=A0A6I1FWK9_9BACI|nr:anti-repressor SinI family protein [Bacillus aerolatus]KAB7707423.1 DNA-binding anti-repressor SinI [Bacillus aerolatus]
MEKSQLVDQEWIVLMKEAKNLGISMEEIREFLKKEKVNLENVEFSR